MFPHLLEERPLKDLSGDGKELNLAALIMKRGVFSFLVLSTPEIVAVSPEGVVTGSPFASPPLLAREDRIRTRVARRPTLLLVFGGYLTFGGATKRRTAGIYKRRGGEREGRGRPEGCLGYIRVRAQ